MNCLSWIPVSKKIGICFKKKNQLYCYEVRVDSSVRKSLSSTFLCAIKRKFVLGAFWRDNGSISARFYTTLAPDDFIKLLRCRSAKAMEELGASTHFDGAQLKTLVEEDEEYSADWLTLISRFGGGRLPSKKSKSQVGTNPQKKLKPSSSSRQMEPRGDLSGDRQNREA